MTRTIAPTPVRRSVIVPANPALAFEIFTSGIDTWWPPSHGMGGAPFALSVIEPFAGGSWYARRADGSEVQIARVTIWEPARRVVFRWEIGPGFIPDPHHASEVEVTFTALDARTTSVELEHRNFEPSAAHAAFRDGLARGWPVALERFAQTCRAQACRAQTCGDRAPAGQGG